MSGGIAKSMLARTPAAVILWLPMCNAAPLRNLREELRNSVMALDVQQIDKGIGPVSVDHRDLRAALSAHADTLGYAANRNVPESNGDASPGGTA
jgi:hypothetical protein